MKESKVLSGFGNHFETEAREGALPQNQNSPQKVNFGLYAEQLTGSAFTSPRHQNLKSWLYRIRPSVVLGNWTRLDSPSAQGFGRVESDAWIKTPNPMRWNPLPYPTDKKDWLDGICHWLAAGDLETSGLRVSLFVCNESMDHRFFMNSDAETLILPQEGSLRVETEMGHLEVSPSEVIVIPRGIRFRVQLKDARARGYVCENFGSPFEIPGLGPIGANGLASPRHFIYPSAAYFDEKGKFEVINQFSGQLWSARVEDHPLNVVAWHGNYAPYKYDLKQFNTINTVSFDHPDPSIFTVLTSASEKPGVANIDFVIFPPRWMVAQDTFRPPYFHRNVMSEYMGLIYGVYDAKEEGFVPGGGSLHNRMTAHGPDAGVFEKASQADLKPQYLDSTLAFMFETRFPYGVAPHALNGPTVQKDYFKCWSGLQSRYPSA